VADGVARINWFRALVGLGPVTDDPDMTRGCELHVAYMIALEAETGGPGLTHPEDLSKPYASEEGDRAGRGSVLSYGQGGIAGAVDGWMNTLYHRLPLIHPGLERVGVAFGESYACVYTSAGTRDAVAPHPLLWPPPDIESTERQFHGNESPCPTVADPLAGGDCPPSAAIATLGLHGMGDLGAVAGRLTNLDTDIDVPLFATYWAGGASPHEQQGYLDESVALVPEPGSSLERALYQVTIDATVGGTSQVFRWRFRTGRTFEDVGCDDLGAHRTFDDAYPIAEGSVVGRICEFADMYSIGGEGSRLVRLELDHSEGDLDLVAFSPSGDVLGRSEGVNDVEELTVDAGSFVQVYGVDQAMGLYELLVE
jgi:hypothetical protein